MSSSFRFLRAAGLLLLAIAPPLAAQTPSIFARENFQSYAKGVTPAGWADTHVGETNTASRKEFRTAVDPLVAQNKRRAVEPARGDGNIVFGTTLSGTGSSARPGAIATYTPKIFFAGQLHEIRGRVLRVGTEQRIGFTLLSGYPSQDRYYFIEQQPVAGQPGVFVLRASVAGTSGSLGGQVSSTNQIVDGRWYRFALQVDESGGQAMIRARFWPEGTPEPPTWMIDAVDGDSSRLRVGRFGFWAARATGEGGAYIDDLTFAEADVPPPSGSAPIIVVRESGTLLQPGHRVLFNRDIRADIAVEDDKPGVQTTSFVDALPYTSGAAITLEGVHTLTVLATDSDGNEARAAIDFLIDKTPPVVTALLDGAPIAADAIFAHDVVLSAAVSDVTETTIEASLDGQAILLPLPIAAERAHDATIRVVDQLGWATTVPAKFIIDKTPPVVTVLANGQELTSASSFNDDVVVTFSATDPNLAQVTATLNGVNFVSGGTVSAEGVHAIIVNATDRAGNGRIDTRNLTIHHDAPSVRLLANGAALQAGAIFGAPVTFTIEVTDRSATSVVATIDDATYTPGASYGVEGLQHTIRVAVTNAHGITTTLLPQTFTVDLTPPTLLLTESGQPFGDGSKFNRDATPQIQATDNFTAAPVVQLLIDGIAYPLNTPVTTESAAHSIEVTATDAAGHPAHVGPLRFLIDKTRPVVALTEAVSDAPLPPDALFARPVQLHVRVLDLTNTTVTATSGSAPLDLGLPVVESDGTRLYTSTAVTIDGSHQISVAAIDEVNWTSDPAFASFTIDQTPPVLTITKPAADATVNAASVTVEGTSDDAVAVTIGGRNALVDTATKTFTLENVLLAEGSNDLVAEGHDRAGNHGSAHRVMLRDSRAPELHVTAPGANACFNTTALVVEGTVNDAGLAQVKVTVGATTVDATLAADHQSFTATVPVSEGKTNARVEAIDALGQTSVAIIPVTVDRTKPIVEVMEGGHAFTASLVNRSVSLNVRTKDADPRAALQVTLDGQPYTSGTPIESEHVEHVLRAQATDCAGNVSDEAIVRFFVDRTAPQIVNITPANGATIPSRPSITGELDEPATMLELRTGRSAVVSDRAFTLDNILEEGTNKFTFLLRDPAGNEREVTYSVTTDTTAPSVEIVENGLPIATDALFNRAVTPVIRSSEGTVTATLNGNPFASGTTLTSDGNYTLTASAADALGNQSGTATATFRIDRSAPMISITAPAANAVLTVDRTDVRGTLSGSDIASVVVNGVAATLGGSDFTTNVPLDFGLNTLTATATDRAGNTASATIDVTRDRSGAGLVLTSPADHMLTNRPTALVAGQVLTPAAAQSVTINGQPVAVDLAGLFRRNDFPLVEGENVITATTTTAHAQTVSARVTVIADFTPPSVTVRANGTPLEDGARFATSPSIALEVGELAPFTLTIDGEATTPGVPSLVVGGHTLSAIARDAAGNETRVDRIFFIGDAVDVSGCGLSNIEPATGNAAFDETIRISGRSGGASGVLINGRAASVADGSFCGDAALVSGRNEITIQCADSAGQPTSEAPVTLVVYRYLDPEVAITAPSPSVLVAASKVTVTGTVGAGVTSGDVNGIPFTVPDDGAARHTFSVPDVAVAPGLNVIIARAKTASSRIASASVHVRAAGGTPQLAITSPLTGTETGATSIDVSGIWSNLDPSTLTIASGSTTYPVTVRSLSDTSGTFVAAGVALAPGVATTLRASGRNALGIQVTSSVDVRQTEGAPSISIATPVDVAYVPSTQSGPVTVTGSVSAEAGSQVQVNGVMATMNGANFSVDVDVASAASGITPVIARVLTPAGAQASDAIRVVRFLAPLSMKSSYPAADATGVDPGAAVVVLFTNAIDKATAGALKVIDTAGADVSGELFVDRDAITFAPAQPFRAGQRYTVTIGDTLKDIAGGAAAPATFAFTIATTAPSAAPIVDDTPLTGCFSGTTLTGRVSTPGNRVRLDVDGVTLTTTSSETGAFRIAFTFSGQAGYHLVRVREIGTDGTLSAERALCFRLSCALPQVVSATLDRQAKTLGIRFNRAMDASSLAASTITLAPAIPFTIAASNDTATLTLASVPDEAITLTVKKEVKDTAGAMMVADYTQSFPFDSGPTTSPGNGFITGAIYDATTGRPLAGAKITNAAATSAQFSPSPRARGEGRGEGSFFATTFIADAAGRYSIAVPEGAYTLVADAPGYTTVWRQIVVAAGAGVVPIDIRLTRRGDEVVTTGATQTLTHGGDTAVTKPVELALLPASLPPGTRVRLTAAGAQALAGLLPLGWSPVAAAEIAINDSSAVAPLPGAKLTFTIDAGAVTAASKTLSLVQHDSARDEWRVVVPVANIANRTTFDITSSGNYALVYPDNATLVASAGAALPALPNPCAATPDVCKVTSRSFVLNPHTVLPSERTVATLTTDGTMPYPSGTAVQAFIDEQLNLADGRVLVDPPFATDLLLYRTFAGDTAVADFHLAPSAHAAGVVLRDGVDHIRIVDYPGRIDRGTLIGAEGGRVPGDDNVIIDIPAAATREALHASVASLPAGDLAAIGPIAGFHVAAGFTFELTRTTTPQVPDGIEVPDVELLIPARATFSLPSNVAPAASAVVIAELLPRTPFGVMPHLSALTQQSTSVDLPNGRVYTTRPIVSTELPLDGIVHGGRYLILVANNPIAYAYGQVRSASNVAVSVARVSAPPLGVRDVTRVDGLFVLPVPSKPAGPFTLTPRSTAIGDGPTYTAPVAPDADTFVNVGVLTLSAQPPRLTSVTPTDGAEIDASSVTVIQATFDTSIDPTSIANGIRLTNLTTNANVGGTVTMGGAASVRFTPGESLRPSTRYAITIGPSIRSLAGAPYASTTTTQFTTRSTNSVVRAERIRITYPDENGKSTIIGTSGAIPGNAIALATRRGRAFIDSYTSTASADGAFSFDVGGRNAADRVSVDDLIDLEVLDPISHAVIAIIELTQFSTADGHGFYARADRETSFTTVDGIRVVVPAGAFDKTTLVTAIPAAKTAFTGVPNFDAELTYATSVELQFEGVAKKALDLEMPVPSNFDPSGKDWLLGYLGDSVRGPRVLIAHTMYVENGRFKTGLPSHTLGGRRVASNTALFGEELQKYLAKIRRSGIYATVNLSVPGAGLAAGFIQGLQGAFDLFWDTLESLYAPFFYLTDNDGKIVIPVVTGKSFTIVGVDANTGNEAFQKAYNPIPPGDPGVSVVLDTPLVDRVGPYPIFATPFRVAAVDVEDENVALTSVRDFVVTLKGGAVRVTTTLPSETPVVLFNATKGSIDASRSGGLSVPGSRGDRVVLLIGENEVAPDTSLSVVFSEPLAVPAGSNQIIEDYLRQFVTLETKFPQTTEFLPITGALHLSLDSGGRRLLIGAPASLIRGNEYRLMIAPGLVDWSGLGIGQTVDANGNKVGGLTEPLALQLSVRAPGGLRGSFDLESGVVRDQALNGNLLFITALDGGIAAYDVSDPAGMGASTTPVGKVTGGPSSYWGIASDHHGRVYATGLHGLFGFVRSFRLGDFLSSSATRLDVQPRSSAIVSWAVGAAAELGVDSRVIAGDRPEAIPRKLQIMEQDDAPQLFDGRESFKNALGAGVTATTPSASGSIETLTVSLPRDANFPYATQRITVENLTLGGSWSGDATLTEPAVITGILALPNDELRVTRNLATYGVISLFGYGVGVFDLNAVDSNAAQDADGSFVPGRFHRIREAVRLTDGKVPGMCVPAPAEAIQDLNYSPDAVILPGENQDFRVLAVDSSSGILDINISSPTDDDPTTPDVDESLNDNIRCDERGPLGLRFHRRYFEANGQAAEYDDVRLAKLRTLFRAATGRDPVTRFTGAAQFHWRLEAQDNRVESPGLGLRGSIPGTTVDRDYMLVPGNEYGLLVIDGGGDGPAASPSYTPLAPFHIADVIWIPNGAYAVRVIPRTNLATVVDGKGYVLLVDLTRIDERWSDQGPLPGEDLFPTVKGILQAGVDVPDPRIVWKSEQPLATGTLAPVIDTETGFVYVGNQLVKTTNVVSALDPRIQLKADVGGNGLSEIGGIVPLGIDPPVDVLKCDPTKPNCNASLAAFRLEVALPGAMGEAMAGRKMYVAVESERVFGAATEQTIAPMPPAHLRQTTRGGQNDARANARFEFRRLIPESLAAGFRHQRGFNRWVSPWIVGIADPRASERYEWPTGTPPSDEAEAAAQKSEGCSSCQRPKNLRGKAEEDGVFELYTTGRLLAVRPEAGSLGGTPYAYLADHSRLTTRFATVMADTVRPPQVLVAAQNPPIAGGMLQETTYLHSGEIETSNVDLDAGGRAGWNAIFDRTYRSRTVGGTVLGAGWDSTNLRRLRPLPNGDVEYRDGAGEVWLYKLDPVGTYTRPRGLFLTLSRTDRGFLLVSQKKRMTSFDELGRLQHEADEFAPNANAVDEGNIIRYLYDENGRLGQIIDPVGRATTLRYFADDGSAKAGLLESITDWRGRVVGYDYDAVGRLTTAALPRVDGKRPTITYGYGTGGSYNNELELATNLQAITDPAAGSPRVTFAYGANADRDKAVRQSWATGESATFSYQPNGASTEDALHQVRTYTLTPNASDAFADRVHIVSVEEKDVDTSTWAFGSLPASVTRSEVPRSKQSRIFGFNYEPEGMMRSATLAGVRTTTFGWVADPAGWLLKSQTTEPSSGSSAQRASTNSIGESLSRVFTYDGAFATKISMTQGGGPAAEIAIPFVRYRALTGSATNDAIAEQVNVDKYGRPTSTRTSGGTDTEGEGSEAALHYEDVGAPHALGLLESVTRSDLESTIRYPTPNTIVEKDETNVETTTELDEWLRPKHVFTSGVALRLDETITYDERGRVHLTTRKQNGSPVTSTIDYDEVGRITKTTTDRIAIGESLGSIESRVDYDLGARTVRRTLPSGAVVTETLDGLGRVKTRATTTGSDTIVEELAYDLAGNLVYSADDHVAHGNAFDIHGRLTATRNPDGTGSRTEYDAMGQPRNVQQLDDRGSVVAETTPSFTPAGHLQSLATKVDEARTRTTETKWDGAGRSTVTATLDRVSQQRFDRNGLLSFAKTGKGTLAGVTDVFDRFDATRYETALLKEARVTERNATPVAMTYDHDELANPIGQKIGSLEWKSKVDEAGNVVSSTPPLLGETKLTYDARGSVTSEQQPGSTQPVKHAYDPMGAAAGYRDQTNEVTSTTTDLLGRPLVRTYPDGTTETFTYDGSRLLSMTDRQRRTWVYGYNDKGQLAELRAGGGELLEKYGYDNAGRLASWTTNETELRYENYDMEGRPRMTRQIRFANGDGFTTRTILNEFVQQHEWNVHGERSAWTMPLPAAFTASGWTNRVEEDHDAMGNVSEIRRTLTGGSATPSLFMTADHRNAGRPTRRTITTTSGAPIVRDYGYDATTGQLDDMTVAARGIVVAGSSITYDGTQVGKATLHGLSNETRANEYHYDARGRLQTNKAARSATDQQPSTEVVSDADFRKELDRTLLPPLTFAERSGHKIATATRGNTTRAFDYAGGAERVDDGRFIYEFDARGRLVKATEKPTSASLSVRRFKYVYAASNRVVGRRAEYAPLSSPGTPPVDTAWKLEDRAEILGDDALPAEATYVWDPISDTLVTIASASGDVLRQIIHGGAAYDDPIEVAVNENGVAHRLYPIFDEAGAGTLQAIVNEQGELVSRTVEEDAYGGDEYGLAGAAVDRISVEARKTNGVVESVTVSVRTTEQLDEPSIAEGARLAAVDDSGVVVRSAQTTPQLFENYTLRWTLTAEEWTALTSTANGATRLSIAVTNTLRARAWDGDQPILPAPDAAGMFTSTALPVETRTSFADLTTWIAAEPSNEKVIFEAATLAALAGRTTPASRLIVAAGFQALPFSEPATGLVYARARWYDPSTGSFLTPDPMGYQDSSNLYSFAGGDPVNGRDPSGMSATVGDGGVYVRNDKTGAMYKVTLKQARENTLALQDLLMSEGGYSAQRAKDFLQDMGLKYTHPYQRPVVEKVLPQGDNWFMNGLIATSGLPAQNRQQEIVQGGLQIAGTAAMVLGGTYGNAGGVSEEPVQILSTPSGFSAPISHTLAVEEGWIPKPVSDGRWAKAEEGGRTVYWADDIFEPATRSSWQDPATGRWKRGTNVERMADGLAPIGIDGKSINLHHLLQEEPGALAEAPGTLHNRLPHKLRGRGESFRNDPVLKRQFENYRREYWKQRSKDFQ